MPGPKGIIGPLLTFQGTFTKPVISIQENNTARYQQRASVQLYKAKNLEKKKKTRTSLPHGAFSIYTL